MKIHLLGTGAADGVPALYSDSRVSKHARSHGGRDVRSRSAAIIDDHIKLDFGPDTWHQVMREGLDATQWTALVMTHSHADHLAIDELQYTLYPFNPFEYCGFTIYGNAMVLSLIAEMYPAWPFELVQTRSFQAFEHAGMAITPVHAYHKLDEDAHNLIFQDGDATFFYATDTGIWEEDTWDFLKGYRVDGMVIECTEGFAPTSYNGHLDVEECKMMVDRLRKQGTLVDSAPIFTTHHSHSGDATYDELCAALNPSGIQVGYDGLRFEL